MARSSTTTATVSVSPSNDAGHVSSPSIATETAKKTCRGVSCGAYLSFQMATRTSSVTAAAADSENVCEVTLSGAGSGRRGSVSVIVSATSACGRAGAAVVLLLCACLSFLGYP